MAPRAHWKGFLKLSFVSCPIALYPAIATEQRLSFRRVNRSTGNRLRQQLVDEVTGETVRSSERSRGYQVGENQFLIVEDAELDAAEQEARERPFFPSRSTSEPAVANASSSQSPAPGAFAPRTTKGPTLASPEKDNRVPPEPGPPLPQPARIENNRTIEIDRFVEAEELDPAYFQTPYYIAPRGEIGEEAFVVIRDAMRTKGVVAMGRVVLARRERPLIIEPFGRGLRGITLRFAHEIREPSDYFSAIPDIQLPQEMLRIAEHIVESKTSSFDRAYLEDRYRAVVLSKLKQKHAEAPQKPTVVAASKENIINLMDALKRSLPSEKMPRKPSARRRSPKTSKTERSRSR